MLTALNRWDRCVALLSRVDGGVSRNNTIVQLISDLLGVEIELPSQTDMTALGAAYMAGLAAG